MAQWIEHRIPVPRVGGSSPFRCTKQIRGIPVRVSLLFVSPSGREGTRMIQCGADERRRRRLDGAEPLFSFAKAKENANESLPVYQKMRIPKWVSAFFNTLGGTRKGGRAKRGKKVSGGHFFSPWESPLICRRIRYGCGCESNILSKTIFLVCTRKRLPIRVSSFRLSKNLCFRELCRGDHRSPAEKLRFSDFP